MDADTCTDAALGLDQDYELVPMLASTGPTNLSVRSATDELNEAVHCNRIRNIYHMLAYAGALNKPEYWPEDFDNATEFSCHILERGVSLATQTRPGRESDRGALLASANRSPNFEIGGEILRQLRAPHDEFSVRHDDESHH